MDASPESLVSLESKERVAKSAEKSTRILLTGSPDSSVIVTCAVIVSSLSKLCSFSPWLSSKIIEIFVASEEVAEVNS